MNEWSTHIRVAVITPYFQEPEDVLRNCHESVLKQTYPCTHFLVADGFPQTAVQAWPVEHIVLSRPHQDFGDTPRGLGALSAMCQDYDAVAFLDADNWYDSTHIESMVNLHHQTGALVCTAGRNFHRVDGSFMYTDTSENDGRTHVDTSCQFLTRGAFGILPLWILKPKQLAGIGDRVIWQAIVTRRYSCAHRCEPTVAYRTNWQIHYQNLGESPPAGAKAHASVIGKAQAWWDSQPAQVRDRWQRYFDTALP